jgi:hypothetical protein
LYQSNGTSEYEERPFLTANKKRCAGGRMQVMNFIFIWFGVRVRQCCFRSGRLLCLDNPAAFFTFRNGWEATVIWTRRIWPSLKLFQHLPEPDSVILNRETVLSSATLQQTFTTRSKNCKNSKYSCHCRPLNVCRDWFWDIHVSRDDISWDKLSINSMLQLRRCLQTFCLSRRHSSLVCRQVTWIIISSVQQYRMWCTSDWWWLEDSGKTDTSPSESHHVKQASSKFPVQLLAPCCVQYLKHLNAGFS